MSLSGTAYESEGRRFESCREGKFSETGFRRQGFSETQKAGKLHADKAYDFAYCRRTLRQRGIQSRIARRSFESSARLGRHRLVVERTLAWLARFRRLAIRYEQRADIHQAFLTLGCVLISWNFIQRL